MSKGEHMANIPVGQHRKTGHSGQFFAWILSVYQTSFREGKRQHCGEYVKIPFLKLTFPLNSLRQKREMFNSSESLFLNNQLKMNTPKGTYWEDKT